MNFKTISTSEKQTDICHLGVNLEDSSSLCLSFSEAQESPGNIAQAVSIETAPGTNIKWCEGQ